MKRWSSLQKELYKIIDDKINFQIHLSIYRMNSQRGSTDLPRYWITLDKEIVFDYPKQFIDVTCDDALFYPYQTDISDISGLLREYIDTPKNEVFGKIYENDKWGLSDILKSADKRFGKNRLKLLANETNSFAAKKIIELRLNADINE